MPNPIPILKTSRFCLKMAGKTLIPSLDFEVFPKDVIWIQGENGIGKTTLLRAIFHSFLKKPSGFEIQEFQDRIPVSYLGHKPGLYPQWTLRMNLDYFQDLAKYKIGKLLDYDHWVEHFQMKSRLDQKVSFFSQGTMQKAGLIRSMFLNPTLLLLDEPTSGLDPDSLNLWQDSMKLLPPDTSVVFISHDTQIQHPHSKKWILSREGIQVSESNFH
jgi:ABC-2 type transport system ATP-binding protein